MRGAIAAGYVANVIPANAGIQGVVELAVSAFARAYDRSPTSAPPFVDVRDGRVVAPWNPALAGMTSVLVADGRYALPASEPKRDCRARMMPIANRAMAMTLKETPVVAVPSA